MLLNLHDSGRFLPCAHTRTDRLARSAPYPAESPDARDEVKGKSLHNERVEVVADKGHHKVDTQVRAGRRQHRRRPQEIFDGVLTSLAAGGDARPVVDTTPSPLP